MITKNKINPNFHHLAPARRNRAPFLFSFINMLVHIAVLAALLTVVLSQSDDAHGQDATAIWMRHFKQVERFECRLPQARSYKVAELLVDGEFTAADNVVPHSTVLHRCDSGTGCCKDPNKECKVAKADTIDLSFYVVNQVAKTKGIKVFSFTNHTLCSCQISTDDIK